MAPNENRAVEFCQLKWTLLFAAALLGASAAAEAAGPDNVARSNWSLWPEPIDTVAAFDRASRAEILSFSAALGDVADLDEVALEARLHIKQADVASVRKVAARLNGILFENYKVASGSCHTGDEFCDALVNEDALLAAAHRMGDGLSGKFHPWYRGAVEFNRVYADELVRLAALFPRVSSEIDTYSPIEHTGFELPDRHFLFSFDDGPTNRDGQTDVLLPILNQNGVHGIFFMLGERLEARKGQSGSEALDNLYQGQCAALHGWQHLSHQKWSDWQSSVTNTRNLVQATFPTAYRGWFRPPYGQRLSDSADFFTQSGLGVALWNIDSQDWNAHVTADEAAQRVSTLMLLWRRGVILFHDIHPKAKSAVPWLINQHRKTGVVWEDCRPY